jgi:hypothetical protein
MSLTNTNCKEKTVSIAEVTTTLNALRYQETRRAFEELFPAHSFPGAIRGTMAVIHGDTARNDSLITLRCCLDQSPTAQTKRPFFLGLRFSGFGLLPTTLDLVSVPTSPGRDPIRGYVNRAGWLSPADRIDTRQGSRSLPNPLISAVGEVTIRTDQSMEFSSPETSPPTLLGINAASLAQTIARYFDMLVPAQSSEDVDTFFNTLLEFLREYQGKPEFYEQLALWLHERRVRITPELAEALYMMKASDYVRTAEGGFTNLNTAYMKEVYTGLGHVVEKIRNVQDSW